MARGMRKKVLFIMQLPPPVHGSSMASELIRKDVHINEEFDCRYVNLSASRRADEVSSYSLMGVVRKLWRFFGAFLRVLGILVVFRPNVVYVTITCYGVPFLKDAPFVLLGKSFGCRVVLHQHNKGMSAYVDKPVFRTLLPLVYRGTTVVLLSERLYEDVSRVVKREQVVICPNGV